MPTGFEVASEDAYPLPPDFETLKLRGEDEKWEITTVPDIFPGRSLRNCGFYLPKGEQSTPGGVGCLDEEDEWGDDWGDDWDK
jgi:hypothetical protein